MLKTFSKSQIDRLGGRLKKGEISEADLWLLDEYRRSFVEAFDFLVGTIRKGLALEPTRRPEKSTSSIIEKLRRESFRLSQIQDITSCRLIVPDIAFQQAVVQSLKNLFECKHVFDRRQQPSHGYRAVHVIVSCLDKVIEIQVRTSLQQLWAELSERLSDVLEPAIKYGGGEKWTRMLLVHTSDIVAEVGLEEMKLALKKQRARKKLQEAINIVSKYKEKS